MNFPMAGIRPDQGPPLSIPLGFFVTGASAIAVAGVGVAATAGEGIDSAWSGAAVGLVHLGSVGLLMSVMLGALYQMLPVVAGAVVPAPRLAHVVLVLLVAGTAALVLGQVTLRPGAFAVAASLLGSALVLFWLPAAFALAKSPARTPAVDGIRLAFAGLAAVAALGVRLAYVRADGVYPDAWPAWRFAHAHLGLLTWVGALVTSVSWQVVPMFYLAPDPPRWATASVKAGVGLTLFGLLIAYTLDLPRPALPWFAAPGALAVWLIHPIAVARAITRRRRRRRDASLRFWWLSMGSAVACLPLGAAAAAADEPRLQIVYGFVALWGWAAALVHGMLTRIVPFLVWFHRCAPLAGIADAPTTRELFSDAHTSIGFALHATALALGIAAAATGEPWLWRALGAGLVATSLWLLTGIGLALARAPRAAPSATRATPRER